MNLKQKYNRQDFLEFLNVFLPNFEKDIRVAPATSLQVTNEAFSLGGSADSDLNLQVFEMTHTSSSDARVSLAADGFRIMRNHGVYQALMVYKSAGTADWRLSLLTANPELGNKGEIVKKLSNPRRYSFLLGLNAKTHTPEDVLIKKGQVKDFADLKSRFSIEIVNKDFYAQVARLFTELAGGKRGEGRSSFDAGKGCLSLVDAQDDKVRKEFAVRLVGRLVFCWFLKKKSSNGGRPLLSEQLLSSEAVKNQSNYYHKVLEPLFFQVLNEPIETRRKEYLSQPWADTPFLNGGLFGPHENDYYEPGVMGASKYINTLKIPDEWFERLFQVFELYNFTIDENTSVDVELSVEPEMLGRIFENLLAEINPETGETARKSTGSYYTPRPIVEYMVDESLKQYLAAKTEISHEKLAALLIYDYEAGETGLTKTEQEAVIKALDSVKIIDPACGSGAFPMSILQKMLLILQKIDPNSECWLDKKLAGISDVTLRRDLKNKLKTGYSNYIHKLGIIRDSIYGVDIQPIAVEISKLRFFLSLIVEEKVDDAKENRGVKHLPNLEFKFVCANSLIGMPKFQKDDQLFPLEDHASIEKLRNLRDIYLNSSGEEKETLRVEFQDTQTKMRDFYFKSMSKQTDLFGNEKKVRKQQKAISTWQLGDWQPFTDKSCEWFDPEWMFGVKEGFDIVIGNPPYGVSIKGNYRETVLKHLAKVPDFEIYYFFIELAFKLLKIDGVKVYILPNTMLFNVYANDYRVKILSDWRVIEVLDCTSFVVFEAATVRNIVTVFLKSDSNELAGYRCTRGIANFEELVSMPRMEMTRAQLLQSNTNWALAFKLPKEILALVSKIRSSEKCLFDYFPSMTQGLIAYDKYQGQDKETIKSRKYHYKERVKKSFKLWLWGEDVQRYHVRWNGKEYIDYCDGIANPRDPKYFIGPRILIREITNPRIYAAYTEEELYNDPAIINILPGDQISITALLAILNSKLASFYHFNSSPKASKGAFPKILVDDLRNFPLPELNKETRPLYLKLSALAQRRIHSHSEIAAVSLEDQIDEIVCECYGLTKIEKSIIQRFFLRTNKYDKEEVADPKAPVST